MQRILTCGAFRQSVSDWQYDALTTYTRIVKTADKILILQTLPALIMIWAILLSSTWADEPSPVNPVGSGNYFPAVDVEAERKKRFDTKRRVCGQKGWENCDARLDDRLNLMIIGDSMAADMQNIAWDIYGDEANYIFSDLGGCAPHDNLGPLLSARHPKTEECLALNRDRYARDFYRGVDAVFVSVMFGTYDADYLADYIHYLNGLGIDRVVVLGNYLVLGTDLPQILAGKTEFEARSVIENQITRSFPHNAELKSSSEALGFFYIDLEHELCRPECMLFFDGNIPFTWDRFHLSREAATYLARQLDERIRSYVSGEPR